MTEGLFTVRFITPIEIFERQVVSLRLRDASGYFGIMKGHRDFMTSLVPSLGFYRTGDGGEMFLAIKGGLVLVRRGSVMVLSREVVESRDADRLGLMFGEEMAKKDLYESSFKEMLSGMEKSFWKKRVEAERMKG